MQDQCAAIGFDGPFEVQLDVAANRVLFRHLRVEGGYNVPADVLRRHHGLIGSTQDV